MLRELNYRWAVFSILWMTGVAYGSAVIFYQAATFAIHPMSSLLWTGGILLGVALVIGGIRLFITRETEIDIVIKGAVRKPA